MYIDLFDKGEEIIRQKLLLSLLHTMKGGRKSVEETAMCEAR